MALVGVVGRAGDTAAVVVVVAAFVGEVRAEESNGEVA